MNTATSFDERMMRRALQLATFGRGFASPNPMVGAVITDPDGRIVGEGWHRRWGGPHAEVNAVASARARGVELQDCTIYVTLEPCAHYGKTPPCARLLAECRFRRAVIGCVDPFPKVDGRGIGILREAGIEVTCGVLERECRELNRRFFFAHTHRRPWVQLKWAQSLDGFMAAEGGYPVQLSSPVSRVLMHRERAAADAILVGTGTILSDDPALTVRCWPHRHLRPVVIQSHRLPRAAQLLRNPDLISYPHGTPLSRLLDSLYADHGITSLMVEGGAALLCSFLDENLWQELRIEVSPVRLHKGVSAPEVPLSGLSVTETDSRHIFSGVNNQFFP